MYGTVDPSAIVAVFPPSVASLPVLMDGEFQNEEEARAVLGQVRMCPYQFNPPPNIKGVVGGWVFQTRVGNEKGAWKKLGLHLDGVDEISGMGLVPDECVSIGETGNKETKIGTGGKNKKHVKKHN